jgi:hypothetical protein
VLTLNGPAVVAGLLADVMGTGAQDAGAEDSGVKGAGASACRTGGRDARTPR